MDINTCYIMQNYQFKENELETTITCPLDHITVLKTGSFKNKFYKYKKDQTIDLCTTCAINEKQNKEILEIQNKIGHKITKIEKGGRVEYLCGNCNTNQKSDLRIMRNKKRTKFCPKCQNDKNKPDLDDIRDTLKDYGFTFLEYQNNKKINVRCSIGHETFISISGLKGGRGCGGCSSERRKKTCLEKYGHTNVIGSKHGINKAKETCMKKYGVEHHRKVPEIQKKAEATVLEKYGVKWVFTKDEVYNKIRETHKLNHGVEYPLQSKEIQKKCLEEIKKRYGSSYPMQNPESFKKAQSSSFKKKSCWIDGKECKDILGYEGFALQKLHDERTNGLDGVVFGTGDLPHFEYKTPNDNKNHVYYPDIFIPEDNLIIEIKSFWTMELDKNIELKKKSVVDNGYKYLLWVFDGKGELLVSYEENEENEIKKNPDNFIFPKYEC